MGSIGILVGGGPAPGINGVIGAAATTALQNGDEVLQGLDGLGLHVAHTNDVPLRVQRGLSR